MALIRIWIENKAQFEVLWIQFAFNESIDKDYHLLYRIGGDSNVDH